MRSRSDSVRTGVTRRLTALGGYAAGGWLFVSFSPQVALLPALAAFFVASLALLPSR